MIHPNNIVFYNKNDFANVKNIIQKWGLKVADIGKYVLMKPTLLCSMDLSLRANRSNYRFYYIALSVYLHAVEFDGYIQVEV